MAVTIERMSADTFSCRYVVSGELERLKIPQTADTPARTDGLWRGSCFELFLRALSGASYDEFNFSPSGHWAAYRFERYRQGPRALELTVPVVTFEAGDDRCILDAAFAVPGLGADPVRIAAAVVLEDRAGMLHYWALQHPDGKPDFHHEAGFIAQF